MPYIDKKELPKSTVSQIEQEFDNEFGFIIEHGIDNQTAYDRIKTFWVYRRLVSLYAPQNHSFQETQMG